ncbi:MAG TPA: sulfatase-like hydrolase/transferase [Acidimicrobiia bacterium]|nr:sulfatase-like hydrolase/transferase [Acidimicrobiia bacterium]
MRPTFEGVGEIRPVAVVASIVGLGTFALGQPLLDLLGRNPEFFVARRFPVPDIWLLASGLLLVPFVLAAVVLAVRAVHRDTGIVLHLVLLAALGSVAAATILVNAGFGSWPPVMFYVVAVAVSAGLVALYARFPSARTGFSYLGLAPFVVLGWFAFATPTSDVLFASRADVPEAVHVGNPTPVVMIVYDEFPAASMIRGDGSLDVEHFPSFGRLAADGVWYRNAVGVHQQTEEAVPALLTGRVVSEGSIPTTAHHPFTIFSLLSGDYDVEAIENVTELCPPYICGNVSRPVAPPGERWESVLGDLSVVYAHLIAPDDVAAALPPIDQGWGGFVDQDTGDFDIIDRFLTQVSNDRRRDLTRFLESIGRMEGPASFRYAHFLYPHHPWDLTADGRLHNAPRPPGRDNVGWGDDAYLVAQGWQRHLIQAHWADTMLGRVLDQLESQGVYDEALIVVAADHGITIRPGTGHQRTVTDDTIGTISFIPLFVKYPAGHPDAPDPGTVDDLRAETVDVVPTIGDVLDVSIPWATDGVSLLDEPRRAERTASVMRGTDGDVEIPLDLAPLMEVVEEKDRWFPGGDPYLLAPPQWESLLGQSVANGVDEAGVDVILSQAEELAVHQPGAEPIPAYLSGTATVPEGATGQEIVAVTADGVVVAATRTYEPEGNSALWEAMVPPELVDEGAEFEVWLVRGSASRPSFVR